MRNNGVFGRSWRQVGASGRAPAPTCRCARASAGDRPAAVAVCGNSCPPAPPVSCSRSLASRQNDPPHLPRHQKAGPANHGRTVADEVNIDSPQQSGNTLLAEGPSVIVDRGYHSFGICTALCADGDTNSGPEGGLGGSDPAESFLEARFWAASEARRKMVHPP